MIRTLADDTTRDIWNGVNTKQPGASHATCGQSFIGSWTRSTAVTRLEDLKAPPGNRLHALTGDLRGCHAIRVNDQFRIVFRFDGADAFDVRCTDYH